MTMEERARKLQWMFYHGTGGDESELQFIERFLRETIEEEREACAQICDGIYEKLNDSAVSQCGGLLLDAAMDIRARAK